VIVIGLLVALPVLYVASVGPVFAMANRGQLGRASTDSAYGPVLWAAGRSDTLKAAMIRYYRWWDERWPGERQYKRFPCAGGPATGLAS
jgi:hypothetical protein